MSFIRAVRCLAFCQVPTVLPHCIARAQPRCAPLLWTRLGSKYNKPRRQKDEAIDYNIVQVIDDVTTRLRPPQPLTAVLAGINRKTHYVELVAELPARKAGDGPGTAGEGSLEGQGVVALVKIIDKKEAAQERRDWKERKKAKGRPPEQKEIQMTWAVGAGDLEHKLNKAREELGKGNRIDVMFGPKPRQALPRLPEMQQRMQEVVDAIDDVGYEWQPRTLDKGVGLIRLQRHKRANSEGQGDFEPQQTA